MSAGLSKIDVGVVGASGYTGAELIRLLSQHPRVRLRVVTSEQSAGKPVGDVFPSLRKLPLPPYESLDVESIAGKADFFFIALPSGDAMDAAAGLLDRGKKVVDLSADFRLRDAAQYQQWYRQAHRHAALLARRVYGLPEVYRERLKDADLVANPGCYPVSVILGLLPVLKKGFLNRSAPVVVDAKSGISGAGRRPALSYHFPEMQEGLLAYGLAGHRHVPEMEQELSQLAGGEVNVTFTPHLVPMTRGILSTLYIAIHPPMTANEIATLYDEFYKAEPFVQVLEPGQSPNPHHLQGSNLCQIGIAMDQRSGLVILLSAIDNLVKGAAGLAIQNMNVMAGYEESLGLPSSGLFP